MTPDRVSDDEELYRRVPAPTAAGQMCYQIDNGRVVFQTAAFNDASKCPSVDRAALRRFDPHRTRLKSEDGIVVLSADAIRRLGPIPQYDNRKRLVSQYAVDVAPDPIFFANCAHALVIARPQITGSAFKRLKDGLVRLANETGWLVEPNNVASSAKEFCAPAGSLPVSRPPIPLNTSIRHSIIKYRIANYANLLIDHQERWRALLLLACSEER